MTLLQAVLARWNNRDSAHSVDHLDDFFGIIAFVGDDEVTAPAGKQRYGLRRIVSLTASENEIRWVAQSIDVEVNFGAKSTPATP